MLRCFIDANALSWSLFKPKILPILRDEANGQQKPDIDTLSVRQRTS